VDGLWTCRVFDPSTADYTLTDVDFVTWQPTGDLTTTLNENRVRFSRLPYTESWNEVSASDSAVQYANETSDSHRIDTWLTDEDDATALAGHLRFFKSAPAMRIAFEERGLTLLDALPGDLIAVTRTRATNARDGEYNGQLLMLVSITKSLGPDCPKVTGTLEDLGGQAARIFRLAPASAGQWSTATDAQKAFYGYLSDANGYIDSTDPLTKGAKVLA